MNNFAHTLVKQLFNSFLLLLAILGLFTSCAVQSQIQGGEIDQTPPKILSSVPLNGQTSVDAQFMVFEFDEYVKVSGAAQKLVTSPPFNSPPEFSMRGKVVTVKFADTLAANTTYVFNFGEGIVDNNENNPLDSNVFVFSTGDYIDSFFVKGKVLDAFTLQPVKEVLVMLYKGSADSLPLTSLPRYFAKTDEQGVYDVRYMAQGDYKIFALAPENGGYLFDLPSESIGFLTERILAVSPNDSAAVMPADILLSKPKDSIQFAVESKQLDQRGFRFIFKLPVSDFVLRDLIGKDISSWTQQWGVKRDTLMLWMDKKDDYDSVKLELSYSGRLDTFFFRQPSKFAKTDAKQRSTNFTIRVDAKKVRWDRPVRFVSETPIGYVDFSNALLISGKDTLSATDAIVHDVHGFTLDFEKSQGATYSLLLVDSTVCDRFGVCNDSILLPFGVQTKDEFGGLEMNLSLPQSAPSFIWQLVKTDGKIVRQRICSHQEVISYSDIPVGSYQVRLIFDRNNNGEWDPANYALLQQPEKVVFYETPIEVRANWMSEIEWIVIE